MHPYDKLSGDDWQAILKYMYGSTSIRNEPDTVKSLFDVRRKLRNRKAFPEVFRGITLKLSYLNDLIDNKPFQLQKRSKLASWTVHEKAAFNFADRGNLDFRLGMIVVTSLRPGEVIVDLSNPDIRLAYREYREKLADERHISIIEWPYDLGFTNEAEVLAKFKPSRKYNLCKNVATLVIHNVGSGVISEDIRWKIVDKSEDIHTSTDGIWNYSLIVLDCDNKGNLKVDKTRSRY